MENDPEFVKYDSLVLIWYRDCLKKLTRRSFDFFQLKHLGLRQKENRIQSQISESLNGIKVNGAFYEKNSKVQLRHKSALGFIADLKDEPFFLMRFESREMLWREALMVYGPALRAINTNILSGVVLLPVPKVVPFLWTMCIALPTNSCQSKVPVDRRFLSLSHSGPPRMEILLV